jgi:hypothetical protein
MKLRIKSWLIAGSLIVSVVGCNEPQGVVSAPPPGFEIARKPPAGEAAAQAIGETGIDLKTTPKPAVVRPNTANSLGGRIAVSKVHLMASVGSSEMTRS